MTQRINKLPAVVLTERRRLWSEAREQIRKVLQKDREEIACCLVHEATIGVEFFVRVRDENLRLQKGVCIL
jgi:hypothetical protein